MGDTSGADCMGYEPRRSILRNTNYDCKGFNQLKDCEEHAEEHSADSGVDLHRIPCHHPRASGPIHHTVNHQ